MSTLGKLNSTGPENTGSNSSSSAGSKISASKKIDLSSLEQLYTDILGDDDDEVDLDDEDDEDVVDTNDDLASGIESSQALATASEVSADNTASSSFYPDDSLAHHTTESQGSAVKGNVLGDLDEDDHKVNSENVQQSLQTTTATQTAKDVTNPKNAPKDGLQEAKLSQDTTVDDDKTKHEVGTMSGKFGRHTGPLVIQDVKLEVAKQAFEKHTGPLLIQNVKLETPRQIIAKHTGPLPVKEITIETPSLTYPRHTGPLVIEGVKLEVPPQTFANHSGPLRVKSVTLEVPTQFYPKHNGPLQIQNVRLEVPAQVYPAHQGPLTIQLVKIEVPPPTPASLLVEEEPIKEMPMETKSNAAPVAKSLASATETKTSTPVSKEVADKKEISSEKSEKVVAPHDQVYIYISMASGGRGVMANYNKAVTILQSYDIPFQPVEITLDDKAKLLWKYSGIAKGKKLPAIVRDGEIKLGFEELLEANEFEEVHDLIFDDF